MTQHPLHFFGDSFTAGDELVDWQYVENYPPYTSFWNLQEPSKRKRPPLDHLDKKQLVDLSITEKKQSYAGLLGGVNHGISGCSMQTIARHVIEHLEHTNNKSIIFIQPTDIYRWCEFVNGKWTDFNSTYIPTDDTIAYYKFRLAHSTDFSNLVLWYNCLITLIGYVRSHHNTADWWLVNNGVFNSIESLTEDKKISNMINTIKKFREKMINFPQVDDMDYPYYCVGGHVNNEAHNELAERIKKKLQ